MLRRLRNGVVPAVCPKVYQQLDLLSMFAILLVQGERLDLAMSRVARQFLLALDLIDRRG